MGFYILNWIYRYFSEDYVNVVGWVGGLVQTGLYCDFFYYYAKSKWYGNKLVLPVSGDVARLGRPLRARTTAHTFAVPLASVKLAMFPAVKELPILPPILFLHPARFFQQRGRGTIAVLRKVAPIRCQAPGH